MKQKRLYVFLALLGLLSDWTIHAQVNQSNNTQPNILFILIDDMGWKDITCAGSSYYETPNIDKLASQGMRFLNAYSASPVCTPSRGAIFSGKCPARTQLTTVFKGAAGPDDRLHDKSKYRGEQDQFLEARHRHALPEKEVLIPQALSEAGYKTAFFGKWHIGECPGYYPDNRGFQVAKGYRTEQHSSRSHWMKDFGPDAANMQEADQDAYVADALTTECVKFIQENKDKRWMAVMSHYLVHSPVQAKPEKLTKYKSKATTDQNNPGYAGMVESVDESVGRLIQTINKLGLEENTLVIFTSDNGGYTPKNTSNFPLMGGKSFPFEAGMKVPFIVKWPGKIKAGTSEQRIVGMDVYPTMLAAAGQSQRPDQHTDGQNLMPLLTKNETLAKRPIIFHFPHYTHATGPFSSIIEDNWKLIRFYNDEHGAFLLYNLANDPEEQNNLADVYVKKREKLIRQLEKSLVKMKAEMPIPNPDFNSDTDDAKRKNLKFTKELAEKERKTFKSRIKSSCSFDDSSKPKDINRPNIVYILCDDLGYGDIKSMAPEYCAFPTPNVDQLANEGMMFTNAHSGSSVCTPTRYGLLTGRYAWRTWLQMGVVQGHGDPLISEDHLTAADFLKEQGYQTAIIGKWHLNFNYINPVTNDTIPFKSKEGVKNHAPVGSFIPDGPVTKGFDYYYGFHHARAMKWVIENDQVVKEIEEVEMLPLLAAKSVEYINTNAKDAKSGLPFFLYVPLNSPHTPIVPSKAWQGKSGISDYADFVMETDWAAGEIMKALKANDLDENTIVIFSSDNGCSRRADFESLHARNHYPSAHLRGSKSDIWDGGHRVPFFVRWPEKIQEGSQNDQLICHTDFMATCADILGVDLPENSSVDGISFMPALYGQVIPNEREAVVHHSISGKFAIRKGKWKLIFCPGSGGWTSPNNREAKKMGLPKIQLYDMETDMGEENNVAAKNPEIVEALTELLTAYIENGRSTAGEKLKNDAEVVLWK